MAAGDFKGGIEEVTLSAKNHSQALNDGLWQFFNAKSMVDVTLTCHGKSLKVHRLLLAIFSPILKDALLSACAEEASDEKRSSLGEGGEKTLLLSLDYVTAEEASYVHYLVEFLYRGTVTLPKEGLESLLQTARVLAVQGLVDAIEEFIDDEGARGKGRQVKGHEDDEAGSSGRGTNPVSNNRAKRKRKRKPVKVTKVLEEEEEEDNVCDYEDRQRPVVDRTRNRVRMVRRASLRALELARICEMSSSEEATTDQHSKSKSAAGSASENSDADMPCDPVQGDEPVGNENDEGEKPDDEREEEEDEVTGSRDESEARRGKEEGEGEAAREKPEVIPPPKGKKSAKRLQRRKPRQPKKVLHQVEKGESKQSSSKEYRKIWRQTRPVMQCHYCDYETRDKTSYKSHIARHDPSAERFNCDICSKSFRSKKGIRCHMRGHGNPECLHKCTHCEFHTPQKWNWLQHLAVIHKVDPDGNPLLENIKCSQCQFQCVANHQLKAHMLRRHTLDKPYKCAECHYSTVIKHELEKHISIRHKNERFYMCDSCGFRSQTQGGLTRHKRSHTGEKPFKCDLCQMCYADRGKLKIHLLRHTSDEKPFVCHQCGHACRRRDNLRMHLKRIHGAVLESEGNSRFHNYSSTFPKQELSHHSFTQQSQHLEGVEEEGMMPELGPDPSLQSQNVHVEQLVVLPTMPDGLHCLQNEHCLQIVSVGDENGLQVVRDSGCSLLQAVTGALDCANNASSHLNSVADDEQQCSMLHILPTATEMS